MNEAWIRRSLFILVDKAALGGMNHVSCSIYIPAAKPTAQEDVHSRIALY